MAKVFKIIPTTQKYDWGKIGLSSKVAQYATAAKVPGFTLDERAPYAELWMGTHPSGPSRLAVSNETLAEYLAAHPELLGAKVVERFSDAGANEGNIPFLFKVLAIEKALSIQTHPDKKMAEELHRERPDVYKDANHKPEMALALTPFTAMCGFQPLSEIASYLKSTPEFAALIPQTIVEKFISTASSTTSHSGPEEKAALRDLFSAVMTAKEGTFQAQLEKLVQRYEVGQVKSEEIKVKDLVLRLNSQFPGDIGVFCAFMLNYVVMEPGDAIFLAAGEPHAYVSGDIVECMATSDNVIRAGLTPKLRDIPNLVTGLTYGAGDARRHLVKPSPFGASDYTTLYDPPIPEFSVLRVALPTNAKETHRPIDGPSIAIVTEGNGVVEWDGERLDVSQGDVLFVGADTELQIVAGQSSLSLYRAFVETQ